MYKRGIVQIQIGKPRLSVPASLIIDDPAPCINPFYYYRLQVDREGAERHEPHIPLDFWSSSRCLPRHGMRASSAMLPYPAGLGSILEGWAGCDRGELAAWLELARTRIAPHFDITPEILTHTLALESHDARIAAAIRARLDGGSHACRAAAVHGRGAGDLAAGRIPAQRDHAAVAFSGSRADYAQATLEAIRVIGGPPVTFYFIDGYLRGAARARS